MMKTLLYVSLATFLLVAAIVIFALEYGSPVSPRELYPLQVTDHSSGQPPSVSIDGKIVSSSLAVSSVRQHRRGHLVLIVVRQGLIRPGRRSGKFHCDVAVPNDIDQIAIGDPHNVIWHR
jgi:hypothetical protein